jgi:hypothetical protein
MWTTLHPPVNMEKAQARICARGTARFVAIESLSAIEIGEETG